MMLREVILGAKCVETANVLAAMSAVPDVRVFRAHLSFTEFRVESKEYDVGVT